MGPDLKQLSRDRQAQVEADEQVIAQVAPEAGRA